MSKISSRSFGTNTGCGIRVLLYAAPCTCLKTFTPLVDCVIDDALSADVNKSDVLIVVGLLAKLWVFLV